jgi:hypothetical protein
MRFWNSFQFDFCDIPTWHDPLILVKTHSLDVILKYLGTSCKVKTLNLKHLYAFTFGTILSWKHWLAFNFENLSLKCCYVGNHLGQVSYENKTIVNKSTKNLKIGFFFPPTLDFLGFQINQHLLSTLQKIV